MEKAEERHEGVTHSGHTDSLPVDTSGAVRRLGKLEEKDPLSHFLTAEGDYCFERASPVAQR